MKRNHPKTTPLKTFFKNLYNNFILFYFLTNQSQIYFIQKFQLLFQVLI